MTASWLNQYLARAAARERDTRARNYPARIEAGKVERGDAEADVAAWSAIAELFDKGEALTGLTYPELELATSRALQRREQALAECPPPAAGDLLDQAEATAAAERRIALLARRDAVWAIHERISHQRQLLEMRPTSTAIAA